ncbi:MAG: hypothetical protein LBM70_00130, partial [Victivallales bacterium]|nr:hypothetical protein [Victivallales bacterium]
PFVKQNYPKEYKLYLEKKEKSKLSDEDFAKKLIEENNDFCLKTLRDIGYKGLVTQNTFPQFVHASANWETMPTVDGHGYFQHPSKWNAPGSVIKNISSIASAASMFRILNSVRLSGRPYLVGEFNHCFWNPYQHELPLAFTAYAALNDFSSHLILGDPVWATLPNLYWARRANIFDVGRSPVQRAGEFISSLFFLRGDVAPSSHRVEAFASYTQLKKDKSVMAAPSIEQGKLGLLVNYSLSFSDLSQFKGMKTPKADFRIPAFGGAAVNSHDWFGEVGAEKAGKFSLTACVKNLRRVGILPKTNQTDPDKGIFQSETGQITLRQAESLLKVVTPRSEAVSLLANRAEKLDALSVNFSSVDALIGVAAVDDQTVKKSQRLVLIYATQIVNSGMKLKADGETLIELGMPPLLMRTGKFSIVLQNENADKLHCYALRLDGKRTREISLKSVNGQVEITLDTRTLLKDLTPFFELVKL